MTERTLPSTEHVGVFNLECVICGNREVKEVRGGDPDGPSCSKCLGPMVVKSASARQKRRGA